MANQTRKVDISWINRGSGTVEEEEDDLIFGAPGTATSVTSQEHRMQLIDPKYLLDNPYQKRQQYRNIDSLAEKMKRFGFKGSIPVRLHSTKPGFYEVGFGHRRVRSATQARVLVRVEVEDISDEEMILLAISENYEREDLTPLEEGNSFLELHGTFGMSQEAIAAFVGEEKKERIDRGYVRNRMRAAKLARRYPQVQSFLEQHAGVGYLRALGYLEEEGLGEREVTFILERLDQDGWTADTVAAAVKILKEGGEAAEALLNSKKIASASMEADHQQDGHDPSSSAPAQDDSAHDTALPPPDDSALALKRSGQVNDALKRVRRYTQLIGDATPSGVERSALEELMGIIQQILARS